MFCPSYKFNHVIGVDKLCYLRYKYKCGGECKRRVKLQPHRQQMQVIDLSGVFVMFGDFPQASPPAPLHKYYKKLFDLDGNNLMRANKP